MKRFVRFLFDFVRAYTATLIAVGVAIPIMAAVITVGIYIIDPQVTTLQQKGTQLPPDLLLHILGLGLLPPCNRSTPAPTVCSKMFLN